MSTLVTPPQRPTKDSQRNLTKGQMQARLRAAQGKEKCDLILRNAEYFDVFSAQWKKGEIAIAQGTIVGLDSGLKATRYFDATGKKIVPGFIDAHVHLESSMMTPTHFERSVLKKGTTTAICDPHEYANVCGIRGIEFFLESAALLQMNLWVNLSSCVPATHLETNGGGTLRASDLLPLKSHPKALGLAEVMNVPGVLFEDSEVLEKLEAFSDRPIDGHSPLLRGNALSAYLCAGITSCHESSELEEAAEKLSKGMAVWIREGSVAKDLHTLLPLLNIASSPFLGFCTDDRNPLDIAIEGHVDYLVRECIRQGVPAEAAFRASSISVARHYGLDRGAQRIGAIAPGYQADLVLLGDINSLQIENVLKSGNFSQELGESKKAPLSPENTIRATIPTVEELTAPKGQVHIIEIIPGKIITGRRVGNASEKGVAQLSVLERYGKGSKPAHGYVSGFGLEFNGAIASSVGHDSHNLIAAGTHPKDIQVAWAALKESGGGFAVVQNGIVLEKLPLPVGGIMSEKGPEEIRSLLLKLKTACKQVRCELNDPFLQLAFLSLPVIPSLKLTDKGLVDVEKFSIIDLRA